MPQPPRGLYSRELSGNFSQCAALNALQHGFPLGGRQLGNQQRQQPLAYLHESLVGRVEFSGLHDIEQTMHELAWCHALASDCMTVLPSDAGRCRCTPSSLNRTPSLSSASTALHSVRYCARSTLSDEPSQARRQSRWIPARAASWSWLRCAKTRPARIMVPVIFGISMPRKVGYATSKLKVMFFTIGHSVGLGCSSPRRSFPVGQRAARSLPERWPAL